MSDSKYFVYVRSLRGPSPQIWHGDQTNGVDQFKYKPAGAEGSELLYFRKISETEAALSPRGLAAKYPCVEGFASP